VGENGCQYVTYRVRWRWCVCRPHCTEVKLQSGYNDCWSCACVLELYVIDEIEYGVFVFLELFIDDGVMSLEKMNVEVF